MSAKREKLKRRVARVIDSSLASGATPAQAGQAALDSEARRADAIAARRHERRIARISVLINAAARAGLRAWQERVEEGWKNSSVRKLLEETRP